MLALLVLNGVGVTYAQSEQTGKSAAPAEPSVTAFATGERVRLTAPATVVQLRLEVYNSAGKKLFDNEIRGGNVLDWHLQDGQAEPLPDGAYLCVVTVKSLSGKLTQKIGSVMIERNTASLQAVNATQMTGQQAEVIGPLEENASLTVLKDDDPQTATIIAHNGVDGQITRGRGALSFRLGDFFRGKDIEQMRLTAEGNLGIGIRNPAAKLDVDGMIRASQGIIFPDGSIQFSAARKTFGASSLRDGQSKDDPVQGQDIKPEIAGTGTTGRIPKWQDGPNGVLTDSVITELSGSIGINGPPNPTFKLDVNGHNRFRGSNVSFYLTGLKPGGNEWLFQTVDADGRLRIFENSTGGGERLSLTQSGNVGIGTANPQVKLDVAGDIQVSGNIAAKYQDIAEWVPTRQQIAVGTVVILASAHTNEVVLSTHAYDTHVAGVVSAQPGVILGQRGEGKVLVSTIGRVKVKVDATRRPVKIGDLLVTSNKSGTAMKSVPIKVAGTLIHRPGTIIGKALEPLATGQGEILVLLGLQ